MATFQRTAVLVADDDPSTTRLVGHLIKERGYEPVPVHNRKDLVESLSKRFFPVIVLDLYFGIDDGIALIPQILRLSPRSRILLLTAQGSLTEAVRAMRSGATGFLLKSELSRLGDEINSALGLAEPATEGEPEDLGLVGKSPLLRSVREQVLRMRRADATVLITGESGTGKELVARAIHRASLRSSGPFIAINCAAIPEQLLESELFGYRKGAFTDAKGDRAGIFEICSGGTLFLDEVGELSPACQAKVLRVVQEREVTPVGSAMPIRVDIRLLAATNRDLRARVRSGEFREDLYYRLSVLRIEVPPLRARQADIPILVRHFIDKFNERSGNAVAYPPEELLQRLSKAEWPGNVRELQNAVERAAVLSENGTLGSADLFDVDPAGPAHEAEATAAETMSLIYRDAKLSFEQSYVSALMGAAKGNIAEAARISGLPRSQIYRIIERAGEPRPLRLVGDAP